MPGLVALTLGISSCLVFLLLLNTFAGFSEVAGWRQPNRNSRISNRLCTKPYFKRPFESIQFYKRSVNARPGGMNHQKSICRRAKGHHLHDKIGRLETKGRLQCNSLWHSRRGAPVRPHSVWSERRQLSRRRNPLTRGASRRGGRRRELGHGQAGRKRDGQGPAST